MRALPHVRRLPLPGSRVRGAARAEARAGARRAAAHRRHRRAAAPRRSSRASRRSSTTATRWSTRSRARRKAPRSASTAPAAGTRCSTSGSAGSRPTSATASATRCATGRARKASRRTRRTDGTGYLRHLVVREGRNTGQVLVQLVTAPGEKFEPGYFVEVVRRFPQVRSVHWSINDRPAEVTNLPSKLLWGDEWIEEELGGLRFRVRPNAFLQTNTAMAERLYALARDAAALTGDETVWDLYCGIGTIGLSLARRRADRVGDRGLGGVGRVRARERGAERRHERGVLRRQRRPGRRGAARALRPARTSSSSIRRAPGLPARRCATSAASARRVSSTSRATRRRSRAT